MTTVNENDKNVAVEAKQISSGNLSYADRMRDIKLQCKSSMELLIAKFGLKVIGHKKMKDLIREIMKTRIKEGGKKMVGAWAITLAGPFTTFEVTGGVDDDDAAALFILSDDDDENDFLPTFDIPVLADTPDESVLDEFKPEWSKMANDVEFWVKAVIAYSANPLESFRAFYKQRLMDQFLENEWRALSPEELLDADENFLDGYGLGNQGDYSDSELSQLFGE